MKGRLMEKCVTTQYRCQLYEELLNLKQVSYSSYYISRFSNLIVRCDINEEEWRTVIRFVNGLKPQIQRELKPNFPKSLEEAYRKAIEVESRLHYQQYNYEDHYNQYYDCRYKEDIYKQLKDDS